MGPFGFDSDFNIEELSLVVRRSPFYVKISFNLAFDNMD